MNILDFSCSVRFHSFYMCQDTHDYYMWEGNCCGTFVHCMKMSCCDWADCPNADSTSTVQTGLGTILVAGGPDISGVVLASRDGDSSVA